MSYALQPYSSEPPSYTQSLRPSLLCLDGGGTRIFVQLQMLCELMHRLAWDLKLISSRPSIPQKCEIYPADCFDYIGGGGCGSIIAYLLAAGLSAQASLEAFMTLAPVLASTRLHPADSVSYDDSSAFHSESLLDLQLALDGCLPRHEQMNYNGDFIIDIPARASIWIANGQPASASSSSDNGLPSNGSGVVVRKGEPIRRTLLPLVLAEVEREMRGEQQSLDHTLEFLQAVCPVFFDCSLLLALGTGDVPAPPSNPPSPLSRSACAASSEQEPTHSGEPSWLGSIVSLLSSAYNASCPATTADSYSTEAKVSQQAIPPAYLAPSVASREQMRALNGYIPTRAYGRSYIRMSPDLTTRSYGGLRPGLVSYQHPSSFSTVSSSPQYSSMLSGQAQIAWPGDWEAQCFSEHRMLTASYCSKAETGTTMDRVVDVLKRRDLPGVNEVHTKHTEHQKWDSLVFASAGYVY
ncbi:hypothetical protein M408DRAFT_271522 [Serendipita vermifera MAFF 305830]|uniref:PNPLA domain-containing protein n=1 Tax=Serendipita vermifera MAFF 305830 TaxID=933852 RepID=A0A0C2WXJ5_SERVB|nr:hypothetical protein M408DRAFT_271522 [Serendipita vermifera MAFF 305830]